MNHAIRGLTALAVLISSTASVWAGCGYQSYYAPSYYQPTYYEQKVEVKKVIAVEYIPLAVLVPTYSVGYAAPAVAAPAMPAPAATAPSAMPAPCAAATTACEERVAGIRAELNELKRAMAASVPQPSALPPQSPPAAAPAIPPMAPVTNGNGPPPVAAPAGKSVVVSRCSSCHDSAVAAAKGKGVNLTQNGAVLALTPEVAHKAMREAMSGKMPKNGPVLTDQEFSILLQELLAIPTK